MSIELEVVALELDGASGAVALVLAPPSPGPGQESAPAPRLVLPVVIGPVEAAAIASARTGVRPPRPLTHDLLLSLVSASGGAVVGVEIVALHDGAFHAEITLAGGARVDARTSDAVAVALRAGVPVRCREDVFEAAAVPVLVVPDEEGAAGELERFREFIDQVDPDDFADS